MNKLILVTCVLFFPCVVAYGQGEESAASGYTSQGMTAYSAGDYRLAIELFKKAFLLRPDYSALAYNIACCYALQAEKDSAIAWLQKTFELGSYLFMNDEDLVVLHSDPRYQQLVVDAQAQIEKLQNRTWEPVVSLPEQYSDEEAWPVVIGLHGYGTNPGDFAHGLGSAITGEGYILCCPYGPRIGGTTAFGWGVYDEAEPRILEAVRYVTENYRSDEARIILLGFSEGGQVAFHSGLRNAGIFSGVVSIAGYYDEELNEYLEREEVKELPFYIMIGENDFQSESNRTAEQVMKEKGMRVKLIVYQSLGHAFPPNGRDEVKKALRWIEARE